MQPGQQPWYKEPLTDRAGYWDIGNISVCALLVLIIGAIPTILWVWVWSVTQTPPRPIDVIPIGTSIAAICGGFGTALAALGMYLRMMQGRDNGGEHVDQQAGPVPCNGPDRV